MEMKGDKEGKRIRRGEIERGIGNHAQLYPLTDVSYSQQLNEVIWYGVDKKMRSVGRRGR
jgi:hypothetical protein